MSYNRARTEVQTMTTWQRIRRDIRCMMADQLLSLAVKMYPYQSDEQIEACVFLVEFMRRRVEEMEADPARRFRR